MTETSFEEIRQTVIAAFQTMHTANYPMMKVNYPNFIVVDLEKQLDPFISVWLDLSNNRRAALGDRELLVDGLLQVYFYYREGTGMSGAYSYTDTLNTYMGMQQIGPIYYQEVKPVNIQSFPGWKGILNSIPFQVNKAVLCAS